MPTALRSGTRGPCTRGTFPWSTDLACSCRIPCVFATGASLPNITCALHRCWSRLQSLKQPQVLTLFAWHVAARESDSVVDWALKKKKKGKLATLSDKEKRAGQWPSARVWCTFMGSPCAKLPGIHLLSHLFLFAHGMCYISGSPAFACCTPLPKREILSWTNPLPHQTLLPNTFPSVAAQGRAFLPTG